MNNNQKIGLGFLILGLLTIPASYFVASSDGFILAAMLGLMAIVFGGFQLIFAKTITTQSGKVKVRKSRHR